MMKHALRVVKIAGIEIRLDLSWFIIFILITWSLAGHYFPGRYPAWPQSAYWVVGVITSLLFFASVLIHELSHSFVARAHGVPVRNITLFIFGGAAQITQEPKHARDEFVMAFVGPATSIGIAAFFGIIWLITRNVSQAIAALSAWLGIINLLLAAFNLIPGFPLDGGRVLRSIIWGVTQDLRKATLTATTVGRAVAFLFIFVGVWMIFTGNWPNGLWLAFIGWFLENAATSSYRQVALRELLQGHTAGEAMMRDCPQVAPDLSLEQLVRDYILYTGRRCFPVVKGGRLWGAVTLHDVKKVPREQWAATTVEQVMTPYDQLKKVGPEEDLFNVFERMTSEDVNQLIVVDDGQLLGMVARDSVLGFIRTRTELGI